MSDTTTLLQKIDNLDGLTTDEKAHLKSLLNNPKSYGLIWEDKPEEVERQLLENLPVLVEVKERYIAASQPAAVEKSLNKKGASEAQLSLGLEDYEEFTDNQINPEDAASEMGSAPHHILIEGDNLHALTALSFTHKEKIDVIYIDPPYNTGNKDFKYNDSFVDKEDSYRHSKWLSFMHKRLVLAKQLISTAGVITISISYHELDNLLLLSKQLFNNHQVVCVTVQTSGGKPSGGFNYQHEYLVFITPLDFEPNPFLASGGVSRSPHEGLTLSTFTKVQRPNQAYPIFVNTVDGSIIGVGKSITERIKDGSYNGAVINFPYDYEEAPTNSVAIWPVTSKGDECVWRLVPSRLIQDWNSGYIKVSRNKSEKNKNEFSIQYLPLGVIEKIQEGLLKVVGKEENKPTLIFGENTTVGSDVPTIWSDKRFLTNKGSATLKEIINSKSGFSYPKPLDLIVEVLRSISKTQSFVLDFFAGSGTTLQATMQLNAEDGGSRKCILVTNNENNIAEEVCYERNKRVINGYTKPNGDFVSGLKNNHLHYYKAAFVPAQRNQVNRRQIVDAATEIICIRESAFTEVSHEHTLAKEFLRLFQADSGQFTLVLYYHRYMDEVVAKAIELVKQLSTENGPIKIYAFAPQGERYEEEFETVKEKITVIPLPEAIYNTYQSSLRRINVKRYLNQEFTDSENVASDQGVIDFNQPTNA